MKIFKKRETVEDRINTLKEKIGTTVTLTPRAYSLVKGAQGLGNTISREEYDTGSLRRAKIDKIEVSSLDLGYDEFGIVRPFTFKYYKGMFHRVTLFVKLEGSSTNSPMFLSDIRVSSDNPVLDLLRSDRLSIFENFRSKNGYILSGPWHSK